jgi:hypothetical protein
MAAMKEIPLNEYRHRGFFKGVRKHPNTSG